MEIPAGNDAITMRLAASCMRTPMRKRSSPVLAIMREWTMAAISGEVSFMIQFPDLDPGSRVMAFSAKWNSPVTGTISMADGMSLNFGPLASIPPTALAYQGADPGPFAHEHGFDVGLAIGFTNYISPHPPGYSVRVNGVWCRMVTSRSLGGSGECSIRRGISSRWTGTRLQGGGIQNLSGNLSIIRSTIYGNTSLESPGGGINHVAGNPTGGAVFTLTDSIVAGNTGAGAGGDIHADGAPASLTRQGANIVPFQTFTNGAPDSGPASIEADPLLAPLSDYGGLLPTMALGLGSPAIDAASAGSTFADQRGFPVVGSPDIGAYEAGTFSLTDYHTWIWEKLPGSATASQHAGDFDFDGDGFTNAQEFLSFNRPADRNHYFRLSTYGYVSGSFNVQYPTIRGRTYTLQRSVDLINWMNHDVTRNGSSVNRSFDTRTVKKQYFRVAVTE